MALTQSGPAYAEEYARRFAEGEARGDHVHGEATFVARLLPPPARVLDAGCGTGRVAVRLARLGYDVVGADVDSSMLAVARAHAPEQRWVVADLAGLDGGLERMGVGFDLVLLAGNVVPLLEEGTLGSAAAACAAALGPDGLLVAGFGLDEDHLPDGCPVTPPADWDAACAAAGLTPTERYARWDAATRLGDGDPPDGYVVAVHRALGARSEP